MERKADSSRHKLSHVSFADNRAGRRCKSLSVNGASCAIIRSVVRARQRGTVEFPSGILVSGQDCSSGRDVRDYRLTLLQTLYCFSEVFCLVYRENNISLAIPDATHEQVVDTKRCLAVKRVYPGT